ncbi:S-adenosyl-L-methionine-dependent methyltransferase, partial [Jimgerdemannia flammicorona]
MNEERVERAKEILAKEEKPVPDFWINKYKKEAAKNWDMFYRRNTTKFFKDRHWIDREFEELTAKDSKKVGCGVGNFIFPVLQINPNLFMYACDFSSRAIDFVKSNPQYDETRCKAFVCDLTADKLADIIEADSVDLVSAIFVLSAIPPEKMEVAIRNIHEILKPGGTVLFRDYGLYDEAQLKFSSANFENRIADNFYVRQDGTMSYFFSVNDLRARFEGAGFTTLEADYVYRETTNRKIEMCIDRVFTQAKFAKAVHSLTEESETRQKMAEPEEDDHNLSSQRPYAIGKLMCYEVGEVLVKFVCCEAGE